MKKSKVIYSVIVLIMFSIAVLSGCSKDDNPLVPPPVNPLIIDSNFFDWNFDTTLVRPSLGMYIADTNKIVIPGNHYSVYINNGFIQYINHNDNDFAGWCVNGTDIKNVYIGGNSISQYRAKLKRWNGTGIEDIAMPSDSTGGIFNIEAISANDIWIATNRNFVYHYSNQVFTTFRFDSKLQTGIIFKDKSGDLYTHLINYTSGVYDYLYMFKFENNIWVEVCKDSVSDNSELGYFIGFSDNKMLRSGRAGGIYYFTGNKWEKYVSLGNNLSGILWGCGRNAESIMFQADDYIYYYDGNRLYRNPNSVFPALGFMGMQYKFGRFYVSIDEDWLGNSYFGIAKFKKQLSY